MSASTSKKVYYLGLDIGTNSVGWAVTDGNYNIIQKSTYRTGPDGTKKRVKKNLWGARLFEEASAASDRRQHRTSRRLIYRRRQRILYLQNIFKEEMDKVDRNFFDRFNYSSLHNEDRPAEIQDAVRFNSKLDDCISFKSDSEYQHAYPTIFHLRKDLMERDEKFDIRLVYLAMAHIVKYRGNFLQETDIKDMDQMIDSGTVKSYFDSLDDALEQCEEAMCESIHFSISDEQAEKLFNCFQQKLGKKKCEEAITDILGRELSSRKKLIIQSICGFKTDLKKLFGIDEDAPDMKASFESDTFEDDIADFAEYLEDYKSVMDAIKEISDYKQLVNLMMGKNSLSDAMIQRYDEHREQLKQLKHIFQTYDRNAYNDIFCSDKKNSYSSYIGMVSTKSEKKSFEHCSQDDFYKNIKDKLKKVASDSDAVSESDKAVIDGLLGQIDSGNFLLRQNGRQNGYITHQIHEIELRKIIENQSKYYPFMAEKDSSGEYKIVTLFEFKVPYYVGPLSQDKNTKNKWAVRNQGYENVKIDPWNFRKAIDFDKTQEAFIKNLKNQCTYLIGEDTLPKCSLLYQKFVLLNEMNLWSVQIGGDAEHPIEKKEKEYLIDNLYLKQKKVKPKDIRSALACMYSCTSQDIIVRSRSGKTIQAEDMHANLSSYVDMSKILGIGFYKNNDDFDFAEEIILCATYFEDKRLRKGKLKKLFEEKGRTISDEALQKLAGYSFKDWGNLSKKLLDGLISVNELGEAKTIIEVLEDFPLTFMEIYEAKGKFDFKKQVEELNNAGESMSIEEAIENQYASPSMKRALRQTYKVITELKEILKFKPDQDFDAYFVECTRQESEKKRTSSRYDQLKAFYKANNIEGLLSEILEEEKDNLDQKKLFLYFAQLGRCAYTGEPIDLDDLKRGNNAYDIDHIIPQAVVKDDSIDNLVLVKKGKNNQKQDTYPLEEGFLTDEAKKHLKHLDALNNSAKDDSSKNPGFSHEKYLRIMRPYTNPLTDEELTGFVNRQLTMTNQAVKAVCDIIRYNNPNAKVVFSKASLVSDFRKTFGLTKIRDLNDFHHAHDAHLNIIVGNCYNKIFSDKFTVQMRRERAQHFESFKIDVEHFFTKDIVSHNGVVYWKSKKYVKDEEIGRYKEIPDSKGDIDKVRRYLSFSDPMVTWMRFTQPGMFAKVSILGKGVSSTPIPLKEASPYADDKNTKYGCYNSPTWPYYQFVRCIDKKKTVYSLESVPAHELHKVKTGEVLDREKLNAYYQEHGLKNAEVVEGCEKILMRTIFEMPDNHGDHSRCRLALSGKSGKSRLFNNAVETVLPNDVKQYMKLLLQLFSADKKKIDVLAEKYADSSELPLGSKVISKDKNKEIFDLLVGRVYVSPSLKNLPPIHLFLERLETIKNKYDELPLVAQSKYLLSMLKMLSCKSLKSITDFSAIEGSPDTRILYNKKLDPGTRIIVQSVTGFYEKVLFVVPKE